MSALFAGIELQRHILNTMSTICSGYPYKTTKVDSCCRISIILKNLLAVCNDAQIFERTENQHEVTQKGRSCQNKVERRKKKLK